MFHNFKARDYLKTEALAQDLEKVAVSHGYKNLEDLLCDCYRAKEKEWDCKDAENFLVLYLDDHFDEKDGVIDFTREDVERFADLYRDSYYCDYDYWTNLENSFEDMDGTFSWQQTKEEENE